MSWWTDIRSPLAGTLAIGPGMGTMGGLGYDYLSDGGLFSGNNEAGGDPYLGMPGRPDYVAGYDQNTMAFAPELEKRLAGLNLDTRGLDAYRAEALRKNPSRWANLQTQKQFQEEMAQRERAKNEGASATTNAQSALAMRGGLSSGAKERLEMAGNKNQMNASQDVGRQGILNRMQIGINDETNRISQLGALPGMENQAFQMNMNKENMWDMARNQDLNRTIAENQNRNQYNQGVYGQQMAAWAANRQASATENAGKK